MHAASRPRIGARLAPALAALALAPAAGASQRAPVPILMYHVVGTASAATPNADLYVRPAAFLEQVRWLARNGYSAVTLDRVLAAWHGRARLPPGPSS